MHFPVSGVDCPLWLPPLVAFAVAFLTTPAGISGAFLLLPFQMSVLGFVSPAVTSTNLVYNVVSIPGGVYRYIRERRMVWGAAGAILAGTLPGVFVGAFIRVRWLPNPRYAKLFVACVLLYVGSRLLRDLAGHPKFAPAAGGVNRVALTALGLPVGVIGGIYGVGGGAIIAPLAMAFLHLPARTIAGAALLGTFGTSVTGVASFELLGRTALGASIPASPDWLLGLLFGAGGLLGSYCGARIQKRLPERWIRLVVVAAVLAISVNYIWEFLRPAAAVPGPAPQSVSGRSL